MGFMLGGAIMKLTADSEPMDTIEAPPRRPRIPKWLVPLIGYGISIASLVWVFSKFDFAQLGSDLRRLDWTWVAVTIAVEIGVYFIDAWRWMVLLRPVGAPSFGACLQSVFVGVFANDILPAASGRNHPLFSAVVQDRIPISPWR